MLVEQAFRDDATGPAHVSAKVHIELDRGDFRAMQGAVPGAIGVKWVNVHPGNRKLGLPTIMDGHLHLQRPGYRVSPGHHEHD